MSDKPKASPINDGYTIKATIPAVGPWGDLVFSYRPMLATEVCEFDDSSATKKGAQRLQHIIKNLVPHLVDWNVTKPNGQDKETISEASLARMPMVHINHMMNAVLSYSILEQEIDEKN